MGLCIYITILCDSYLSYHALSSLKLYKLHTHSFYAKNSGPLALNMSAGAWNSVLIAQACPVQLIVSPRPSEVGTTIVVMPKHASYEQLVRLE